MDFEFQEFSIPIPRIFYSSEHNGIFETCTVCNSPLLGNNLSYFIEKVFKGREVIFEYAMCENCRSSMETEISMESMMNIGQYFIENIDLSKREELVNSFDNSVKPWLNECILSGEQRLGCEEYQICAECNGEHLIVSFLPLMISAKASEEIQKLMSKKTKDSFDSFIKETLNPPVDFKDIPVLI